MEDEIKDYVPIMDKYPELKLRPTTEFSSHSRIAGYDYVQNLVLTGDKAPHGYFYLIVQNGLFGVYMVDYGFFSDTTTIAIKPKYDWIDIYYSKERHFRAVVKKDGKYGMILWTYGHMSNDKYEVPTIYDSIERVDVGRFKAIKNNEIVYFDFAGKVLK